MTYYLTSPAPAWWTVATSIPTIANPNTINSGTIPAKSRFDAGSTGRCPCLARTAPPLACSIGLRYEILNTACCGSSKKLLILTPLSGEAPYQYSINGGTSYLSKAEFLGLAVGTYQLVAKDKNGCVSSIINAIIN